MWCCNSARPCLQLTGQAERRCAYQESQFADVLAHCLATPAVHIVEVPINYAAGAALQVWALFPSTADSY